MNKKELKNLAHDFNNILSTIKSSAELLKIKTEGNKDLLYLVQNIEAGSNRAIDILNEILSDGEKGSENKMRLVEPTYIFHELTNAIKQTFPEKIKLYFDIDNPLPKINCNPNDIYRILLNLCVNAKEAIKDEGEIRVCISEIKEKGEKKLKITVKDTGEGISEENLKKIFNEGFSTKQKERDSGLGLAIVKQMVENHKGKIFYESVLGEGTTANIILPAYDDSSKGKKGINKILLGEDEDGLREVLKDLLESYDYNVVEAANGGEVIDKIKTVKDLDLLIVDKKMPVKDGLECIKELRENNISIPIILATGSMDSVNKKLLQKLMVNDVLLKPYDFDQLLKLLSNY